MSEPVIVFWFGAAVLITLALLFVCLPLLHFRRHPPAEDELGVDQVNLNVRREQLADLKARYESGQYSQEEFETQKTELERGLLSDLEGLKQGQEKRNEQKSGNVAIPLVFAVLIPVLAIGLYFQLGATDQLRHSSALQELSRVHGSEEGMAALEGIVEQWSEDFETRLSLAGVYMSGGRFTGAADHYAAIVKQTGGEQAEPLAQEAQARYMANDNQMNEHVSLLIKQALRVDPENTTALGLAGIAAFESGDYPEAVRAWKALLALTPDPNARQALSAGIARAQAEMGIEPEEVVEVEPATAAGPSLKVHVSLDKALEKIPASAQVYVYARSVGSPMPLVIMPLTVADLPGTFELGNAEAMMAGVSLTDHQKVDVVVRVSLSGNVMQPDYEATAKNVEVGSDQLTSLIVLPKDA